MTRTYTEFSQDLNRRVQASRTPSSGAIEVTQRCPLACKHCYNNLPMGDLDARSRELSLAEHCRILDEIADAGCLFLLYTGGEIFARKDFLEIYTYAKRKGMLVTLFTNGTMITPGIADYLTDWRPFAIEITLYGRTKETYERLTGVPGSYERCLRGIRLLKERNLPLKLKTMVTSINRHEIWDMKRFAEEEVGVPFKFDATLNARIDCSQSPLALRLQPEEVVEFDLLDQTRTTEWKGFCEKFHAPVRADEVERLYRCGGGINSFAIDAEGRLRICVLSQFHGFDLRTGSFAEGWQHFIRPLRERKVTRLTKCATCQIQPMCGMCPANGELENGNAEAPVDFLCQVAHMRAHALNVPIPPHGACEYCEGGTKYQSIQAAAERLRESQAVACSCSLPPAAIVGQSLSQIEVKQ